jgi:hypothetical protein
VPRVMRRRGCWLDEYLTDMLSRADNSLERYIICRATICHVVKLGCGRGGQGLLAGQ